MRHRLVQIGCLSLVIGLPGGVLATAAAVRKEPPKDADLSKKEATKVPERDLAGDITRHRKEKVKERPALEYDQYKLSVQLQVASKRREQIETLQKIIQLGPSPGEAPSLFFRLAELYWEESKYFFFEANRKDDDVLRARAEGNTARISQAEHEKKESLRKSESFQAAAIDQYRTIITRYPKYERLDEVLFFLGQNKWESGKTKDAATVYLKLTKDYPKSRYVPDAWLALGEYYFEGSKGQREPLTEALEAFKKAASFTDSKVYGFALYMQGWCNFNLGDYRSAMDMFKSVVYYGELQGKADTRSTALSREARKDYVVAYSHYGDVMLAKNDFQKVGGAANWWNMLKGLANIYYEDGKDKEATLVYGQLIRERPLSPEAPYFQGRIVDCVIRVGNKKITVSQIRELVRIMKEVEKTGMGKDDERKAYQDARELAERIMSNLAVNWHNEAKKTRDADVFSLAAEVYQDYLEVFADNPKAYDLRFFFAELLNDDLDRRDRAADEYTRVFLQDIARVNPPKAANGSTRAPEKPGRWMMNAAYNAVIAYDAVAKAAAKGQQLPKDNDPHKKLSIPAPEKSLLDACERYLKYVPRGEHYVQVLYKAAYIYYRYNHFDMSTPLFAQIALEHSEAPDELGPTAANLVLDSYNLLGDWGKVSEWARKFYAQPKLAKGKFREELAKVLEQSAFKIVNLAEERQDFAGAAEAYLEFVGEFPKSDLADLALFNASVDFFKGKQVGRSIEVRKQLVGKYPGSRYLPQCIYANGESFETIGLFEQAAESYEAYASKWAAGQGKSKRKGSNKKEAARSDEGGGFEEAKAQVALYNAGVFREGLGQTKEALLDRSRYIELWPDGKDTEAVFLSVSELYQKAGMTARALAQLEEYEKRFARTPDKMLAAELRTAKVYEKAGKSRDSQRIYTRALDYYQKKMTRAMRSGLGPAAMEAVARAAYLSVEPDFAAYERLRLPSDEKRLKSALEAKQKALLEVQKKYTEVVNLKAAEPAICSLYKIGLLYKDFADDLLGAPVPEMPFPKQLEQIRNVWNLPWQRWPKAYRDAISETDFENIKKQVAEARQQFEQAYRDELTKLAMPVEEKAADAFITTVQKSRELAIYNDCSDKALDLLSVKYKPLQFPKTAEQPLEVRSGAELREGSPLLAAVQPVPVARPKASAVAAEPAPDVRKVGQGAPAAAPRSKEPSSVEAPPAEDRAPRRSRPQPAPRREGRPASEPDDPDLLN